MATRKPIDAGSEYLGAEETRAVGEIGGHAGFDVVDKPLPKEAFEMEAFMNEMVTIVVNPPQDPDDPMLVQVGVNGVNQFIPRGEPMPSSANTWKCWPAPSARTSRRRWTNA